VDSVGAFKRKTTGARYQNAVKANCAAGKNQKNGEENHQRINHTKERIAI
jgi:hypothetical protein